MSSTTARPPHQPLVASGQIDDHAADMTVTAAADLTLGQLQDKLAARQQWLPIDGDPNQRLSALIESNSTGPLRLGYGAWRDLVLGVQFITRSGRLITTGGRTMKNVAGYDVTKFMVGQAGLFGQLLTITARTYQRPSSALLVKWDRAGQPVGILLPTSARPQWMMIAQNAGWCGYLGDDRTIAFHESNVKSLHPLETRRQTLEQDIAFRAGSWLPPRPPARYRASVPPTRVNDFLAQAHLRDFAADPAFGIVVGSIAVHQKAVLCNAAAEMDGTVVFEDESDRRLFSGAGGPELELLERLQSAFDA